MELNPLEGENLWQNPSSSNMMQQEVQSDELQIMLQEVISIINSLIEKETIRDDKRQEETRQIKTILLDKSIGNKQLSASQNLSSAGIFCIFQPKESIFTSISISKLKR